MFYYLVHILFIHVLAMIAAVMLGYKWSDMVLTTMINRSPALKGYGFDLMFVYIIWAALILILYPLCKWFARYKNTHQSRKWWLRYL